MTEAYFALPGSRVVLGRGRSRCTLLLLLVVAILALGEARAFAVSVEPGWPQTTGGSIQGSPALGDLDGNGSPEVVVGSWDNKVYAWHADGSPVAGWPLGTGGGITGSAVLGDVDQNGDPEVVVGSWDGKVYAWHGDGTPVGGWPQSTGGVVYDSPALGDLDGDGDLEVVVASDDCMVYAWHGDGSPVSGWPRSMGGGAGSSPALGDLDGDGDLEVVAGCEDFKVYAWHGDGSPLAGWPQSTEHWVYSSPALGDLDGDGDLEVVAGSFDYNVYAWHGDGSPVAGWPRSIGGSADSSPALGDLDGDGGLEVVVGSRDGKVYAWHGDGSPLAGWPQTTAGIVDSSPALGDLDGDGDLEVVAGSGDYSVYAWHGSGSLVGGWPQSTGDCVYSSPALGDLDGDGDLEVTAGSQDSSIYAWSCDTGTGDLLPWPMFRHDACHTGRYGAAPAPVLAATKSPENQSAAPGSEVTFTLGYGNVGTGVAHSTYLRDVLDPSFSYVSSIPPGVYDPDYHWVTWSLGGLAPGVSDTVSLTLEVAAAVAPGTGITNQAGLSAADADPATSAPAYVTVVSSGLTVAKSATTYAAGPGGQVAFTLVCRNSASLTSHSTVLADQLDPHYTFVSATGGGLHDPGTHTVTWLLGDLAPDAPQSFTLTAQVSPDTPDGTEIPNQATLSASDAEPAVSEPVVVTVHDLPSESPVQTNYWDLSATGTLGLKASVGTPSWLGKYGLKAVEVYGQAEGGMGLCYELRREGGCDILGLERSHSFGLAGGVDLGKFDVGIISGEAAGLELGCTWQQATSYEFDNPLADDRQAVAIAALTTADMIEAGATLTPLLGGPFGARFVEDAVQSLTANDRTTERSQWEGFVDASLGEIGLSNEASSVAAYLPDINVGAGGAIGNFWERRLEDGAITGYADGIYGSWYLEGGLPQLPGLYGGAMRGDYEYGAERDALGAPDSYYATLTAEYAAGGGDADQTIFVEGQRYFTRTYEVPDERVSDVLPHIAGTPLAAAMQGQALPWATNGSVAGQQFSQVHDGLVAASSELGTLPAASYQLEEGSAILGQLGWGSDIPVWPGPPEICLKVGFEASALVGQEYATEAGVFQAGQVWPEHLYTGTPIKPSYEGVPGFVSMMGGIFQRAIAQVLEDALGMLNTCVETVIAGAQQIIEAAADAVEGATKIVVDAAAFGRDVVASITSFGTNIGGILFGGAPGAGVSVPYRTSSVATLSDPAEDDQILTLVGRVHAVSVSDSAGPITSFPPGAVTFVTTVLESQVTGAGLPAEALAQVSVYRFDPGSMTWDELETTRTSGDGQVTLTAALSQPGEYAPGVTRLRSEPAPPEVVSVRPVCREIVPGPEVTLSAVVHSDSGMDPESVTVLLDRQPVTGIVTSLSPGGTYLHLSAVATLAPGAHRMVVAAADLSGRLAAASITFYVDRENTFPDVPPDFWAWRYVEAAKLAGIVQGYWDGYRPAELVNRAQMAVYIARGIAGGDALVPTAPATATFPDVPVDHWAFKYVEYCYEEAVVQGYWDGYHPVEIVNRAQMAVYVARALVAPSGDSAVPDPAPPATFPDVPATHWAYKWIEYCHDQEVVQGYWDGYHPDEAVNRAQMAVYVQRAFQLPM